MDRKNALAIIIIPVMVLAGFIGGGFAANPIQQLLNVFVTNFPENQDVTVSNFPQNQVITLLNRTFTVDANDTVWDNSITDPIDVSQYRNVRITYRADFAGTTGSPNVLLSAEGGQVTWSMLGSLAFDTLPTALYGTAYFNITYPTLQISIANSLQVEGPPGSSASARVTIMVFLQH